MELSFNAIYNLIKKSNIEDAYINLTEDNIDNINENEIVKLLSLAAIMMDRDEIEYKKFAYYIILKYSINYKDFTPLYEMSYKLFNIPVIELLNRVNEIQESKTLFDELYDILKEKCKENDKYYTAKQKQLKNEFFEHDVETSVVAPTSFGKTELIKEYILKNYKTRNICVVLPSKAMINQLRLDLQEMFKNNDEKPKVITHYDINLSQNRRNVFVFTQERLFKFIYDRKKELLFDTLLVDEAHNLFEKDDRNKLLARIIILLKNRNSDLVIKYFSPVIEDYNNINFKYLLENYKIKKSFIVNPLIKIEEISYMSYIDKEKRLYDQFFNRFIPTGSTYDNEYEYLIKESKNKNIVYLNRPRECIEKAFELSEYKNYTNVVSDELNIISKQLQDYVHEDYDLARLVKQGIIYHNGIVPENVRLYLENIIRNDQSNIIKFIFANSTLLEGINMPFDNMFILDICRGRENMSYQELKNLIGRVNRYSIIFNKNNIDIQKLLPQVHFVKTVSKERSNFEKFVKENLKIDSKSQKRKDAIENPLLVGVETNDKGEKDIIDNLENRVTDDNKIKTEVGRFCIEANITEFNIIENEERIQNTVDDIRKSQNDYGTVEMMYKIFIENVMYIDNNNELLRLKNQKAQEFYEMFFSWKKSNLSYKEMVTRMLNHWKEKNTNYLYIGSKWGECKRNENDHIPAYVRLAIKRDDEKVNCAIKKIKIENDFVEYRLMKYIEILYKLSLIEKREYDELKYGTSDEIQIYFQMDGLSNELAKKLVTTYRKFVISKSNGEYEVSDKILGEFLENDILKTELEYYL